MQENPNDSSPIFIVGMPRSGTTLMNTLISAHPNIAIPLSETKFLTDLAKTNPQLAEKAPKDFSSFWDNYTQSERFARLDLEAAVVRDRITAAASYDYKSIFASILQVYAIKMDKPRCGEKTPDHYQYVNVLLDWYPDARIIWMVRDPRAVIASLLNVPWSKRSVEDYARKWCNSVDDFERHWATDERVKLVKYEALVVNLTVELEQIGSFLNEEFEPEIVQERSESTSPIINRSEADKAFFKQTLRPVDRNSLEKWRSNLSSAQVATVESIARSKMLKYGYQPMSDRLNRQSVRLFVRQRWNKAKSTVKKSIVRQ